MKDWASDGAEDYGHANESMQPDGAAQQRQFGAPPVRPHSKWNKKANRVGEDGKKQPNRPERLAEGSKTSLKSLIAPAVAAAGFLWVSRNDHKDEVGGKKRR
jgi:hypothetical protein